MSKKWYPMVDYEICTECGICVKNCPHTVYDLEKDPVPVVIDGDSCFEGCHGCGNRCPVGAITYAGDITGWKPANRKMADDSASCGSGCSCGGGCN